MPTDCSLAVRAGTLAQAKKASTSKIGERIIVNCKDKRETPDRAGLIAVNLNES